ncbi:MAG: hypothetical protein NZ602_03305 [Thermoguttaceae bacterium]|nr:hypothetical protein [Thermoguttaceae bacterium]MDW8037904.1 hypothetical protein [Thermoguttaceae bacterium]
MPRQFRIQRLLTENAGNNLVDIPHLGFLRYIEPSEIKNWFKKQWGLEPNGVVLPVAHPEGLLFKVEGVEEAFSPYARVSDTLTDYHQVVHLFAQQGLDIYLLLNPTLEFVRAAPLHIVDIVGDSSHALCVCNPTSRALIGAILGTGVDIAMAATQDTPGKLAGVALDMVDLLPMGAKEEKLELTCFCASCEQWFEDHAPGLLKRFKSFPNPWNLVLQDSGTGIRFIEDIPPDSSPDHILELSRQKGFDKAFGDRADNLIYLREQANWLLRYMHVRHEQIVESVKEIFAEALHGLEQPLTRILVMEAAEYGWTSGVFIREFDRIPLPGLEAANGIPCDEVWFDPISADMVFTNMPFRSYMWTRARYYIDEFLRAVNSVSSPLKRMTTGVALFSESAAKALVRRRLHQCVARAMSGSTILLSLPPLKSPNTQSQRIGFVGPLLTQDLGEKFVEDIKIAEGLGEPSEGEGKSLSELFDLLRKSIRESSSDGSRSED